ncbi:MAG: PKD domain-containing protein, partial [Planctomycetota bacterium]
PHRVVLGSGDATVSFAANINDPDGHDIGATDWDFGDCAQNPGNCTSAQTSPSHTYTNRGSFNVQLTVTDDPPVLLDPTSGNCGTTVQVVYGFSRHVSPLIGCSGCHGTWTYSQVVSLVDQDDAENSRFLLKATNSIGHSGGQQFTVGSATYNTILEWIEDGVEP